MLVLWEIMGKKQIKIMFFKGKTAICRECVTEFFWGMINHDQRESEKKLARDVAAVRSARALHSQ